MFNISKKSIQVMAKAKTYDEALTQMEGVKNQLAEAKEDLRNFKQENKVKRNKPVEDPKTQAQLEKKEALVEKLRTQFEELKGSAKELKPRKDRQTKYVYPTDCVTDKDKKKFRAKMRREAKKAAEPKSETKGDAPVPKKTVLKKKAAEETED